MHWEPQVLAMLKGHRSNWPSDSVPSELTNKASHSSPFCSQNFLICCSSPSAYAARSGRPSEMHWAGIRSLHSAPHSLVKLVSSHGQKMRAAVQQKCSHPTYCSFCWESSISLFSTMAWAVRGLRRQTHGWKKTLGFVYMFLYLFGQRPVNFWFFEGVRCWVQLTTECWRGSLASGQVMCSSMLGKCAATTAAAAAAVTNSCFLAVTSMLAHFSFDLFQ